jgi:hypothetical protein
MKKSLRKLSLNRETVTLLDSTNLEGVAGGSNSACDSICDMISCKPDCFGLAIDINDPSRPQFGGAAS